MRSARPPVRGRSARAGPRCPGGGSEQEPQSKGGAVMPWQTIHKPAEATALRAVPTLADYERERRWIAWSNARGQLHDLPGGCGLIMAYEAVVRHVDAGHGEAVALRCVGRDDALTTVTYAELALRSDRFANVLRSLSIGRGDRV